VDLLASLFQGQRHLETFTRGAEALARLRRGGVDVLLTDKNLPDVNGIDLLLAAKQIDPDTEVIVLTGYASVDSAIQALQLGAFDYLVKPPRTIFEVRRKVDEAFARQAMRRENVRLVDDLRRTNDDLRSALDENARVQAELVQSEKLAGIGTLAAGVAHEISSPLFGVLGVAEAIGDERDLGTIHAHAREIVTYALQIKEIVQQLAGYARASEREGTAPFDLGDAVRDAVRLLVRAGGQPVGRVELHLAPSLPVLGRASELQQVFVNLVKNAVEAVEAVRGRGGGSVVVHGEVEGDEVVVRVEDDGPGVPVATRRRVFDPFYTTKGPAQGTGLGLSIVWRIVERHGGRIAVESSPSGGASFVVRLPRAVAAENVP
jgi:C4-dicarboxylate-specific signal transduction histidine kinase